MATIVTRAGKGSALTYAEADANFTNLNTDKVETSAIGTTVQPYSANLTEFATVNPTPAGLALLDDADASAQRTTLGLGTAATTSSTAYATAAQGTKADTAVQPADIANVLETSDIGVSVQAYDADLTAWAGIATTAKQDTLVSATNIKTINGSSVLGAGDLVVSPVDGDKGDITVSASGATWTIDNSVVTTAKLGGDITTAGKALLDDVDASAQRATLGLGTLATQNGTFSGTSSGTNTGDQNLFSTIAVAGQSNVVADATSDTLTLVAGVNVTITTDATTDTITIASSGGGGGGGVSDGDYGDITVSGSGTVWNIDAGVVTTTELGGDITTAGKALLDDADSSAQRTTLGLGTISTQEANSVAITGGTIDNTTVGATTPSSGSFTSLTDSGNLTFTGTGNRITGDFSNATLANRVIFQTSTLNNSTFITTIPNGSGSAAGWETIYGTDLANCSRGNFQILPSEVSVRSAITGTGTYLPMTFYTGGSEKVRIDTSGNVRVGVTGTATDKLEVVGNDARSIARASTTAGQVLLEAQASDYWSGPTYTGTSLRQSGSTATGTYAGLSNANLGSLIFQNGSAGLISTNGSSPVVFATTDIERMRITPNGSISFGSSGTAYGTSGQVLQSNGDAPPTWVTPATSGGTVTSVSWTGGIVSVATGTTTPAFTIAGTSGGIPYFSSGTTWASSAALTANSLVVGGGAGLAPATITTGIGVVTALGITANTGNGGLVTNTGVATLTNKTLTDPVMIGTLIEDVFTITDGAAFEINPNNGSVQLITLTASRTPKATSFVAGEAVTLMVNDGTAFTLTWTDTTFGPSGVIWVGNTAPTLTATGFTVIEFWKVSTQVYGALVGYVA